MASQLLTASPTSMLIFVSKYRVNRMTTKPYTREIIENLHFARNIRLPATNQPSTFPDV